MKIILPILFIVLLSQEVYGASYYCPRVNQRLTIGEKIDDDWFVWPDNQKYNIYQHLYYKIFKKSYSFSHWTAFPSGENIGGTTSHLYFVSCCGWLKEEKKLICAYRNISEKYCLAKFIGEKREKFICNNKPIEKKLGDSPFNIKS